MFSHFYKDLNSVLCYFIVVLIFLICYLLFEMSSIKFRIVKLRVDKVNVERNTIPRIVFNTFITSYLLYRCQIPNFKVYISRSRTYQPVSLKTE